MGKELGLDGEALQKFVSEQQSIERQERIAQREARQKELEYEMMQVEKARKDQEYEMEMAKIKLEAEIRVKEIEHSHKLALLEKEKGGPIVDITDGKAKSAISKLPKIPAFNDSRDEMDSYLNRFERYATAVGWEKLCGPPI